MLCLLHWLLSFIISVHHLSIVTVLSERNAELVDYRLHHVNKWQQSGLLSCLAWSSAVNPGLSQLQRNVSHQHFIQQHWGMSNTDWHPWSVPRQTNTNSPWTQTQHTENFLCPKETGKRCVGPSSRILITRKGFTSGIRCCAGRGWPGAATGRPNGEGELS